jgi:hypothetical protein
LKAKLNFAPVKAAQDSCLIAPAKAGDQRQACGPSCTVFDEYPSLSQQLLYSPETH